MSLKAMLLTIVYLNYIFPKCFPTIIQMNYTVYIVYILKNPKIKASKIKQNKANKLGSIINSKNSCVPS